MVCASFPVTSNLRFLQTLILIGALVTLVPLYQSEVAPPKIRGLLVGVHGVMICVDFVLASWVGVGFYFVQAAGAQWQIPLAIQALWPTLLAVGVLFLPESPRWRTLLSSCPPKDVDILTLSSA